MSRIMLHCYTTGKTINEFSIGYIINPSLHINRIFREQVVKCLGCYFSINKMKTIKFSDEEEYFCYGTNNYI